MPGHIPATETEIKSLIMDANNTDPNTLTTIDFEVQPNNVIMLENLSK